MKMFVRLPFPIREDGDGGAQRNGWGAWLCFLAGIFALCVTLGKPQDLCGALRL